MTAETVRKPRVLDFENLIAPLPGDDPAGDDVRYTHMVDALREARRFEHDLPQGVWEIEPKKADWNEVVTLCVEILSKHSKDLQVAAWLCEALLCKHGFAGLAEGLSLLRRLTVDYWEGAYPRPEDDDPEYRAAPFHWLNENLIHPMKLSPLVGPDDLERTYSFADMESAERIEHAAVKDPGVAAQAEAEGKPTRAAFLKASMMTPTDALSALSADVDACREALTALDETLRKRFGENAPGLSALKELLGRIHSLVERFLTDPDRAGKKVDQARELAMSADTVNAPTESLSAADAETAAANAPGESLAGRAEAYRMLNKAADYLLATEPHSPAPYLVKRAVAWGGMSLAEVLGELKAEGRDIDSVFSLLGMKQPAE